jgi:hypothetical protein
MDDGIGIGFTIGSCLGIIAVLIFCFIVDSHNDTHYREIIIENGCGEYDSNTAEFKLINRRDK